MRRSSQWPSRLALVAIVAGLSVAGYLLLWTTFMVYDDEGYVLYSLRTFMAHGHLYEQVYTQYGPFFYQLYRGLHVFGLEFTNTTGRELTLVYWVATAACCGALVWRETRGNLAATAATLVGVFVHLWRMVSEPSHPGGLIALLTAIAAWGGTNRNWQPHIRATLIGAIAAALVLTKINVGVFLVISAGVWWLFGLSALNSKPATRIGVSLVAAAIPFALMRPLLATSWVWMFALTVAIGTAAIVLVSMDGLPADSSRRQVVNGTIAAVAVALTTFGLTLFGGTTPAELLEGVILGPLRHPTLYTVPFTWRTGTLALAIGSLPLAWCIARQSSAKKASLVLLPRGLLIIGYIACLANVLSIDSAAFVLGYGLTTAWVFSIRTGDTDESFVTRAWLALLVVFQSLHAYPVAGSQVQWGTFLWVPLAVLGLYELGPQLKTPAVKRLANLGAFAVALLALANHLWLGWQRYRDSDDLGLRGAEHLRLPESYASALRMLARNSTMHGDVLFSLPGMLSFNQWTDLPPPTTINATHWFNLLSLEQQQRIQQQLEKSPRGVLIVQRDIYDLLMAQHVVAQTPLLRWLLDNYRPTFKVSTFEFWARKDRAIAAVNSARLFAGAPGAPTRHKIELIFDAATPVEIASIELRQFTADNSVPIATWTNQNAGFLVTRIHPDGQPQAPTAEQRLPLAIQGLVRLELFTNTLPATSTADVVIRAQSASGTKLGEARFIE